jgi:hypothetical protein
LANDSPVRGHLNIAADMPYTIDDLEDETGLPPEVLAQILDEFRAHGMINGKSTIQISNWDKRQYKSDNVTERVQKYRRQERFNATFQERSNNVIDTDTDTDTEQSRGDTAAAISSFNAIDDRKAESLYMKITGLTFIQRKDLADVTNGMLSIMDDYKGKDGALIEDGKAMYSKWCNTVSEKTGKPYSKLNPGWLGWWIEAINKVPVDLTKKDVKDMTSAEFAQYLERINQE